MAVFILPGSYVALPSVFSLPSHQQRFWANIHTRWPAWLPLGGTRSPALRCMGGSVRTPRKEASCSTHEGPVGSQWDHP